MAGRDLDAFRRAFRAGERVTGRVLSRPDARHALVDVSGFELLAATDTDPPPGAWLSFFIATMHPVVVLREIARSREGTDPDAVDPRLAARLAASLASARAALEARLAVLKPPAAPGGRSIDAVALKRGFLDTLRADDKALAAYDRMTRLTRELAALPAIRRQGRYLYAPWYPPGAAGHELFLGRPGPDGAREVQLAFRLPDAGEVRVTARLLGDLARYMIFAADPGRLPPRDRLPDRLRLGRRSVRLVPLAAPRALAAPPSPLAATLLGGGRERFTGVNLRV